MNKWTTTGTKGNAKLIISGTKMVTKDGGYTRYEKPFEKKYKVKLV